MPIHIHPYFRNKEAALESSGLVTPAQTSDGYQRVVDAENVGRAKNVPVDTDFYFNNKKHHAKE